jgi:apolipoprotein N-acyltransferase
VQVASLGGVYAISFVLACTNAAIAEGIAAWWRDRTLAAPTRGGVAIALVVLVAALGFGSIALRGAEGEGERGVSTPIALVQGNLPAASRWEAGGAARTLETYTRLTQQAFETARPRTVFWPEAALTFFLEREPLYQRALGRLLAHFDVELVVGAPRAEGADAGPPYRNSVYLLEPGGTLRARYDKQRLLPFMEYFPVGVDLLRRRFGRIRDFDPGGAPATLLPTRAGAAGVLVCNEALLPHLAGTRMAEGAAYLVNPSNDSWVSDAGFAEHQFQLAALRAVEQRTFLVRISDSGPSALVDPYGRVVARSRSGAREVVLASLGGSGERSLYGRVGDAFGVVCLAVAIAAAARGVVLERRRRVGS